MAGRGSQFRIKSGFRNFLSKISILTFFIKNDIINLSKNNGENNAINFKTRRGAKGCS